MTPSQMTRVPFGAAFALALAVSTLAANDDAVPEHPTFSRDVLPIMQRSCQTCHRPNMFTPMSLLTYDEVRPWARAIKQRVEARIMPPWFADRTVGVYRDDPSLTSDGTFLGRSIWVMSPVTIIFELRPSRVRAIFIWPSVVF